MKSLSIRIRGAVPLIAALLASPAFAGRPLTTEDAGFIDKGGFEFETYYHRQTERDGGEPVPALSGFHIQPSVGVGFNTQIGIGVDFSRQYNADFDARKSSGAYAIVGKTGIKELTDDAYGIAIAYSVDRTRDVSARFRYDNANVNGALTVPVDKWLLHANIGWQRSRLAATTATTWAIAAERTGAIGPIDLAIETFGNDHDPAWLQVAARWVVIDDRLFIDASYGLQAGHTKAKLFTLGGKLAF